MGRERSEPSPSSGHGGSDPDRVAHDEGVGPRADSGAATERWLLVGPTISRRALFRFVGLGAATLALPSGLATMALPAAAEPALRPARQSDEAEPAATEDPAGEAEIAAAGPAPDHVVELLRPADLLSLRFECFNLVLNTTGGQPRLVRKGPGAAYLAVVFPPQAVGERAYLTPGETPNQPGSVAARLAGTSRLAFVVPPSVTAIPYTPEGLLAWTQAGLLPSTTRTAALTDGTPAPGQFARVLYEPRNFETAIEVPWRLIISPNRTGGWAHAAGPVTHDGRTELWHTRLGIHDGNTVDEVERSTRTVRATWSPDFDPTAPPDRDYRGPFPTSLKPRHRHDLVRLTSDYDTQGGQPRSVQVERLMLSSLGAWLDVEGQWNAQGIDLATWRHRATMGRDSYVRVVERGYLFPFGHLAALVTITERKLVPVPGTNDGRVRAYLEQRSFVVVRRPELTYPLPNQQHAGRELPFRRIRLATLVTPDLDPDPGKSSIAGQGGSAFWIRAGNADVPFHVISEDWDRQRQEFVCPLAFIVESTALDSNKMSLITDAANADTKRLQRDFQGQRVAYAPSSAGKPGDTAFETATLTFAAKQSIGDGTSAPGGPPHFYPLMKEANARIKAVEQLAGPPPGGASQVTTFSLHPIYINSAFNPSLNKGAVFVKLANKVGLKFAADKAGGVATPNMEIDGISRLLGPVGGDAAKIATGTFDPKVYLGNGAKLLGGITLADIIAEISPAQFGDGTGVPKITTRTIYPNNNPLAPPAAVETKLLWEPRIKQSGLPPVFAINPNGQQTTLALDSTLLTKLAAPGPPEFTIIGTLRNFNMRLLGGPDPETFLILTFNTFKFTATRDRPPDVEVDIRGVEFAGPLEFLNELRRFMGSNGGPGARALGAPGDGQASANAVGAAGSGLSLQILTNPPGVEIAYTLAIPNISIGVFSLENLAFTARFLLPFLGDPVRLYFSFCSRENPFLLSVAIFGGGGFVGLGLGIDGIQLFEAALEFGGNLSLDIVIARGSIQAMAGVYFKLQKTDKGEQCELTGYLRISGELEVLGIISLSVEFYLGLTYRSPPDELWGQARLTVQIEVLFFSKSVTLEVERRFAGGGGGGAAGLPAPLAGGVDGSEHFALAAAASGSLGFEDLVPTRQLWDEYCDAFAAFAP